MDLFNDERIFILSQEKRMVSIERKISYLNFFIDEVYEEKNWGDFKKILNEIK